MSFIEYIAKMRIDDMDEPEQPDYGIIYPDMKTTTEKIQQLESKNKRLRESIRVAIKVCDVIIELGGGTKAVINLKEHLEKALEE